MSSPKQAAIRGWTKFAFATHDRIVGSISFLWMVYVGVLGIYTELYSKYKLFSHKLAYMIVNTR